MKRSDVKLPGIGGRKATWPNLDLVKPRVKQRQANPQKSLQETCEEPASAVTFSKEVCTAASNFTRDAREDTCKETNSTSLSLPPQARALFCEHETRRPGGAAALPGDNLTSGSGAGAPSGVDGGENEFLVQSVEDVQPEQGEEKEVVLLGMVCLQPHQPWTENPGNTRRRSSQTLWPRSQSHYKQCGRPLWQIEKIFPAARLGSSWKKSYRHLLSEFL